MASSLETVGLSLVSLKRPRIYVALLAATLCMLTSLYIYHSPDTLNAISSSTFVRFNNADDALNHTKIATLIEPRMSATLIPLLLSYLAIIPRDWPFVVWCSPENYPHLARSSALSSEINSGRLNLTMLPEDIDLHNGEYLSRFLTKPWFYHQFHPEAEWMFFFQTDAILCSASEQSVDDWLGYDWVGSPTIWTTSSGHGGNGGLGIRRISTMQSVTEDESFVRADWNGETEAQGVWWDNAEDFWFMVAIDRLLGDKARWPERDGRDQNDFSLIRGGEVIRPFGIHKGHGSTGLFPNDEMDETPQEALQRLLHYCPEYALVMDDDTGRFD